MKVKILVFFFLIFLMALDTTTVLAFRCGSEIIEIGDFKYKVLISCGEPISTEIVGYTGNCGNCGKKIEHLVYGPEKGRYTILIFKGGILKEIIWERAD